MSNLFDSSNFPTTEPVELQLGDFWAWKRTDLSTDYPTAAYALSYEFNLIDENLYEFKDSKYSKDDIIELVKHFNK